MNLEKEIKEVMEKHKCTVDHRYLDSNGCSDCHNTGYIFDSPEIALIETLIEENDKMRAALKIYSDSENDYWVEKTNIDKDGNKIHIMKNIVQLSKLAKNILNDLNKNKGN